MESVLSILSLDSTKGTKRNVLQAIARIFDPIGILGPTIVKLKILFQKLWKQKLLWDEVLSGALLTEWNDCVKAVLELKGMTFPRAAISIPLSEGTFQIHIFADASTKAYGSVAFLKCTSYSGEITTSFLCAKNRVAPLKMDGSSELTLPKLELTAALIAARLHAYLQRCLKLASAKYFLWTDSNIALNWIQGDVQRWQPYVQNRVDEIRRLTTVSQWNHCRGKDNPADLLTRGVSGKILQKSELWAKGPIWLEDSDNTQLDDNDDTQIEVPDVTAILLTESLPSTGFIEDPLLCYDNYSTLIRLIRVTAFVLRSIRAFKRRQKPEKVLQFADVPPLCATEIHQAESHWLRYVQGQHQNFSNEIILLQKKKALTTSSKIYELSPFLDDHDLLRLGGRLQTLNEPMDIKHPIILPSHSPLLDLLIDDYHKRTMHAGVNTVLTKLRKRFWIVRGRQIANKTN
ncbi:uncharacterized protein LOC129943861 [Eupeodes corollae]|uniref:uncharacterized protein LOC129943861 n=1 Tax=Eupeodes corollae TaxID=290404 RepID=UPI00249332F1|nr:uncharacterized protein LOC129943861 [Eupeodes corollae]